MLGSPKLERVVTIEIEPAMIDASRMFLPANKRAFEDPRSQFVIDDARAFFASGQGKFDIIVAEPSNPWVSGVAGLFTTEFYGRVKSRLAPGGVFAQWVQTYEIDDDLVLSVLAALNENFPSWEIFATSDKDILIVASAGKLPKPDWSVMQYPGVAYDLRYTWPVTANTLERMRVASRESVEPLLRRAHTPNSDFYPIVDLNAEKTRFMQASASGLLGLASGINLPSMIRGQRAGFGDPYAIIPGIELLRSMSINGAMRTGDARGGLEARLAAARVKAFDHDIDGGMEPGDWRAWTHSFSEIAALRHGGMSGVIDTAFFRRIDAYVAKHHVPTEVRATVDFHEAILGWDYAGAAAAADPLIRAAVRGDEWIAPDLLRDGAVMAMLETGDRSGARDAFRALASRSVRPPDDLRNQLLLSYVLGSNAAGPPQ
jgi:spermidine synthase